MERRQKPRFAFRFWFGRPARWSIYVFLIITTLYTITAIADNSFDPFYWVMMMAFPVFIIPLGSLAWKQQLKVWREEGIFTFFTGQTAPDARRTVPIEEAKRSRRIPNDVIAEVMRRDQGRCVECGATSELQLDHIVPFSRGGSNAPSNLQLLCGACNRRKGALRL